MNGFFKIALFCFIVVVSTHLEALKVGFEYWQQFNIQNWEKGANKLYTYAEMRWSRDRSKVYLGRIAECFAHKVCEGLDVELHYSYIRDKPINSTWVNIHRLELEVNPYAQLENKMTLRLRNRLEISKRQKVAYIRFHSRHRLTLSIPAENAGRLKEVSIANEIFYDYNSAQFTQNRFFPINMSFEVTEKMTINLFLMYRCHLTAEKWFNSYVFGSELRF